MTLPGTDNVLRARGQGHKPNGKDQPKQPTTEQALAGEEKMTPTGHHTHKTITENVHSNAVPNGTVTTKGLLVGSTGRRTLAALSHVLASI